MCHDHDSRPPAPPRSADSATSVNGAKSPVADSAMPSRSVRVYQASSMCAGWPISMSRSRSGSSDISVSITSKATTAGRCVITV